MTIYLNIKDTFFKHSKKLSSLKQWNTLNILIKNVTNKTSSIYNTYYFTENNVIFNSILSILQIIINLISSCICNELL